MLNPEQRITKILFDKAQKMHNKPRSIVPFTNIPESDSLLNNIEKYPHFFVLGCIVDRQIPAERAWNIPLIVSKECGGIEFNNFLSLNLDNYKSIFSEKRLHRFNEQMAGHFYWAVQTIHTEYQDNASNIWLKGQPTCKEVIDRFARFSGVGQKISTMATNILVREFKVPLKNVNEIDISVDSQIQKVFKRTGLVPANASNLQIIEAARKIYPKYPGIADSIIWEIGRDWCKTDLSGCPECYLNDYCPKNQVSFDNASNRDKDRISKMNLTAIAKNKSATLGITPGKYRSRFEEILRLSEGILPHNFHIHFTSSKTNAVIKDPNLLSGVRYEFNDWNDKTASSSFQMGKLN
jgi:endonuclease-3